MLVAVYGPSEHKLLTASEIVHALSRAPSPELERLATQSVRRTVSINERLQLRLLPWTSYVIVPVFALANAGVGLGHAPHGRAEDALVEGVRRAAKVTPAAASRASTGAKSASAAKTPVAMSRRYNRTQKTFILQSLRRACLAAIKARTNSGFFLSARPRRSSTVRALKTLSR